MVTIHGTVFPQPSSFTVNFRYPSDIALQYNRGFDNIRMVRKSWQHGLLGEDVGRGGGGGGGMPFSRGQAFTLAFKCEETSG